MALYRGALDHISGCLGRQCKAVATGRMNLLSGSAAIADQKGGGVGRVTAGAGDIGADGRDPVHHALALEKLQRPVDSWWLGGLTVSAKSGDQVIGLDGFTGPEQQLKHPPSRAGHALAILVTASLGRDQSPVDLGGAFPVLGVVMCAVRAHATQLVGEPGPRNRRDGKGPTFSP